MKRILVISDNKLAEFMVFITKQFSEEISSGKTALLFADFKGAYNLLVADPDIGICAVDLSKFDDPQFHDPQKPQHPAIELLRNIWCKFRNKKIVVGFYQHGLDETGLIKLRYKPKTVCPIGKLKRKIDMQFPWIRWDLRTRSSFQSSYKQI
jgi:hypothetical protein